MFRTARKILSKTPFFSRSLLYIAFIHSYNINYTKQSNCNPIDLDDSQNNLKSQCKILSPIIKDLLQLPCILNEGESPVNIPLLTKSYIPNIGVYEIKVMPGESLNLFLHRIYGQNKFNMDSSLYIQLVSYVLSHRWPITGGNITLYTAKSSYSRYILWSTKMSSIGYIAVEEVFNNLELFESSPKGRWVIRIGDDSYLGLSKSGPCIMNFKEWADLLKLDLEVYSKSIVHHPYSISHSNIEKYLTQDFLESNMINDFQLITTYDEIVEMLDKISRRFFFNANP